VITKRAREAKNGPELEEELEEEDEEPERIRKKQM
jgi:hypothetical protein